MRQEGKESHEYGMLYDYLDFVTSLPEDAENAEDRSGQGSGGAGRGALRAEKGKC